MIGDGYIIDIFRFIYPSLKITIIAKSIPQPIFVLNDIRKSNRWNCEYEFPASYFLAITQGYGFHIIILDIIIDNVKPEHKIDSTIT